MRHRRCAAGELTLNDGSCHPAGLEAEVLEAALEADAYASVVSDHELDNLNVAP